jgi:hypothetical protein
LQLAERHGTLEFFEDEEPVNEFKKRKRRECVIVTFLMWLPLFMFLFLLSARLEDFITWQWIDVFAPMIFLWSLLLLWCLTNGGNRVVFDLIVNDDLV